MSAQPRPDRERGLLETLLIIGGQPVELDAHLARLSASLEALFPARPLPDLNAAIQAHARSVGRGGLRVTVAPAGENGFETTIAVAEIDPEHVLPAEPPLLSAQTLVLASGLGGHKWADRALLDDAQSRLGTGVLPLIVDWDGTVLEASRGNTFAVVGRTLLTPPADGRILPGVARARAIEIAAASGFEIREATLCREDLLGADEVFLTGSLRGVERLAGLDGTKLRTGGCVSARIAAELRRAWTHDGLDRVPRR